MSCIAAAIFSCPAPTSAFMIGLRFGTLAADKGREGGRVTGRSPSLPHQIEFDGCARREPLVSALEPCNRIVRRRRLLTIGSADGAFGRLCVNGSRGKRQPYRETPAKESTCN